MESELGFATFHQRPLAYVITTQELTLKNVNYVTVTSLSHEPIKFLFHNLLRWHFTAYKRRTTFSLMTFCRWKVLVAVPCETLILAKRSFTA